MWFRFDRTFQSIDFWVNQCPVFEQPQGDIELPDADKRFDNRNIDKQKWNLVDRLLRPILNDILLNKHEKVSLNPMQYVNQICVYILMVWITL